MRTTIDKAGRVVIPKPIRDALGLSAGTEVDIVIDGLAIRIDGPDEPYDEIFEEDGFLFVKDRGGPRITDADVRRDRMRDYGLDENE